jgi:4'-phosphopantetheinyl transferase
VNEAGLTRVPAETRSGGLILLPSPVFYGFIKAPRIIHEPFQLPSLAVNNHWPRVKSPQPLSPDVVHVWRVSSATDEKQFGRLTQILSADEKKRAAAFKFETDRRHFVAAHGSLRLLLAAYLGAGPEGLVMVPGAHGKPRLAGQSAHSIRFNLSHSGEVALCAFCVGREVGVDIEKIRRDADELAVARQVFTQREVNQLEALHGDERTAAFFKSWTRMEALAKATGLGLGLIPSGGISLPPETGEASTVVVKGDPGHDATWQIISLQLGSGYHGAVAAAGANWKLERMEWLP